MPLELATDLAQLALYDIVIFAGMGGRNTKMLLISTFSIDMMYLGKTVHTSMLPCIILTSVMV